MKAFVLCLMGLVLAGCQTAKPKTGHSERARFYLESGVEPTEVLTLPQSGLQIWVMPKPVFTEYDFLGVDIAQAEQGKCLAFQLTPAATHDLYRLTMSQQGSRLVLVIGDVAFGARRIGRPLDNGELFVFVEVPDETLPALVASLNETCAALQSAVTK
jgi:hypothetical protein